MELAYGKELTYDKVLKRLIEEREKNNLSQSEISALLEMTQSHYSKVELGMKRFTYSQLVKLNETGLDVHYVFSNKRLDMGKVEYQCLFNKIRASDYYYLGQIFYPHFQRLSELQKNTEYQRILQESRVLRFMLSTGENNIWKSIRKCYEYTQHQMAYQFGIDVKKYVKLEKGVIEPDSELISLIYKFYHVPPQIILGDNRGILRMICDAMSEIDENDCVKIINLMEHDVECFIKHSPD